MNKGRHCCILPSI